jgi:hypothetical protein
MALGAWRRHQIPYRAAGPARVYRATTPAMLAGGTTGPDAGSAFQSRLLPICCPRRAIRGRSTVERTADLGWSQGPGVL